MGAFLALIGKGGTDSDLTIYNHAEIHRFISKPWQNYDLKPTRARGHPSLAEKSAAQVSGVTGPRRCHCAMVQTPARQTRNAPAKDSASGASSQSAQPMLAAKTTVK